MKLKKLHISMAVLIVMAGMISVPSSPSQRLALCFRLVLTREANEKIFLYEIALDLWETGIVHMIHIAKSWVSELRPHISSKTRPLCLREIIAGNDDDGMWVGPVPCWPTMKSSNPSSTVK